MASRAVATAPTPPTRTAEPGRTHARVQRSSLRISDPNDAAEREAESTARRVMSMPNPAIAPRERVSLLAARAPAVKAQPKAKANETAPDVTAAIKAERGKGGALSAKTRSFMEPRFKASFANVGIHTGKAAAELTEKVGARAFAYGRDIFFSPGAYQPDTPGGLELLAHELTHTIQQREVVQREADVRESAAPQVQRFGIPKFITDAAGAVADAAGAALDAAIKFVKDFVADKAGILPGFRLLCIILGKNPINDEPVGGGGAAILREIVGFIPFGDKIVEAFNNHGIFEKGGAFVDKQFQALKRLGGALIGGIKGVFKGLGLSDARNPSGVWDRITGFFSSAFSEIKAFGTGLVDGVVKLVREVIIPPLGNWAAANIPKWDLLMAVLGKNPVSDQGESPASQIIGAFMELIGQGEVWANIKKGNAVGRAWQWFQNALKGAKSLVSGLPGQVMATLRSFTIMDVLTIAGAFKKILGLFGSFVGSFMSWAGGTVLDLLEIVLSVVAPTVVPYLKKAGGAFKTIVRNPVGFVRTMVAAGKAGFGQFASNFLTHLKAAMIGWLTGSLAGAGVYIPAGFTVLEILKFVLSVMGLTWTNLRAKLVAATNETTVKALEGGFQIVKTLVTEGPAAAWQEIVKSLTNLKQMAIDAVMDFVKSKIVEIAVTKLMSMLSPAGAFIQAIIAIYNTIMFFVERIRQIAAVAASFIDSIAAIAAGNIAPAAARVEKTMAGMLVLVISFLARLAGLGKVSDAVLGLIKKIQAPIDKAMNAVVAWIVSGAKKLGTMILQAGVPSDPLKRTQLAIRDAKVVAKGLGGKPITQGILEAALGAIRTRYSLSSLTVYQKGASWWAKAKINPDSDGELTKEEDLAKRIRVIADQKIAALKVKKTKGEGTHESPIVMPAGSGIVTIAKKLDDVPLARGRIVVVDTAQGSKSDQRAVVQRPAFGDAIVSGATSEEKRIEVGKYARVVEEIRNRFGSNDAKSANIIMGILQGMPIPANMQEHAGWIGGLKTLAAQEIRRDPVAAITLPANIALASAGKKDLDQVFIKSVQNRQGTGSEGGDFSQSVVGANAIMRGARDQTGIGNPEGVPASRGTAAKVAGAIAVDAATVTELAKVRLKTKKEPSNDEIAGVVEEEILKVLK